MLKNEKKLFPKLKKKLRGFITDESGKISKKDALGLAVGSVLLSGIGEVGAWALPTAPGTCTATVATPASIHASGVVHGHYSSTLNPPTPGLSHGSHGSHGSHSSHGSHGSRW